MTLLVTLARPEAAASGRAGWLRVAIRVAPSRSARVTTEASVPPSRESA
jgi:hypothetical protein